jgi:hypothetical protein
MTEIVIESDTKPGSKRTGSNPKQAEIARLRTTALNEVESPVERIKAARTLLQNYGPSVRSLPIIRTIIRMYVADSNADVSERALKLRAKLAKILDLKAVELPVEVEEQPIDVSPDATNLQSILAEPELTRDEWDREPPLPMQEQLRLADVQRPFQKFVSGQFILRPGADSRALILSALDGRDFSVPVLLKLYGLIHNNFTAGGVGLTSGPLYSELKRILISQGALPTVDPAAKTYGDDLMSEIEARS